MVAQGSVNHGQPKDVSFLEKAKLLPNYVICNHLGQSNSVNASLSISACGTRIAAQRETARHHRGELEYSESVPQEGLEPQLLLAEEGSAAMSFCGQAKLLASELQRGADPAQLLIF